MNPDIRPLFEAFEQSDPIVVFHHISPDPDALGTQFGIVEFLKEKYPEKTILAAGSQPEMDEVSDEQIRNGMALVVDTSTRERVDDQRYSMAKTVARIDHHLLCDDFGELDYTDEKAAAAAQTAVSLLKAHGETIPAKSAQHLLEALISDTQKFMLQTVTPETFEAAAWLLKMGADPAKAQANLYSRDRVVFAFRAKLMNKARILDNLMFSVVSAEDYLSCGCPFEDAKSSVNTLGSVKGIEIWAQFTQNPDGVHYNGSLRSARIPLIDLAGRFGGGGHTCACGVKNLTIGQVDELIQGLRELSVTGLNDLEESE